MEVGSLGWWPNNKKYGENDAREACQLHLYPMAKHGNYRSQSLVRPFWKPYLHNLHFTVYTIHLANSFALKWSHEVVQWSINASSHNFWKSSQNFIVWSMRTSVGTLNIFNILSKNAYATPSLLQSSNNTNSNHLEKC
jgi:hypothetical protein